MYYCLLISPLLVAGLVLATIILLLLGCWIPALIMLLIAALINWRTNVFAFNCCSSQKQGGSQEALRVLTYNLNRAYSTSVNRGNEEDVLKLIMEQDADMVLLQEFNPTLYSEINEGLTREYPYGTLDEEGNRFKSVFSKYPIMDFQQLDANGEILPICVMNVNVNGRKCCVATCHLMSNNFSVVYREIKSQSINLIAGVKKTIDAIHQGCRIRLKQAEVLLELLKGTETPILICGDFNDVCGSDVLNSFKQKGFADAWWKRGFGFGFTYCGMKMTFRLDHILYRGNIKPVHARVIQSKVSDHRPLVATFIFE